ncbi:hypothetical protein C8R46DRAFT_1199161, partial [Mycena filopes]
CLLPPLVVTLCVVLHGPRSPPTARKSSRNGSSPARRQLLPQTSPLPTLSSPPRPPRPNGPRSPATRHSPSCDPSFTLAAPRPSRPAPPCRAPKSTALLAKSRVRTRCGAHTRSFARSRWGRRRPTSASCTTAGARATLRRRPRWSLPIRLPCGSRWGCESFSLAAVLKLTLNI